MCTSVPSKALLQGRDDGVVVALGVVAAVEEEGVALGAPRVVVTNTPNGDTNALGDVEAALDDVDVVVVVAVLDVELSHGDLLDAADGGEGLDGTGERRALAGLEMAL